jgi:hypothetical protein
MTFREAGQNNKIKVGFSDPLRGNVPNAAWTLEGRGQRVRVFGREDEAATPFGFFVY